MGSRAVRLTPSCFDLGPPAPPATMDQLLPSVSDQTVIGPVGKAFFKSVTIQSRNLLIFSPSFRDLRFCLAAKRPASVRAPPDWNRLPRACQGVARKLPADS